ncbi:MAG: hypothetical protein HY260_00475 [Chloroflexi bacterium]|nr:hypothetical protein [Chloroflexota bacterium]
MLYLSAFGEFESEKAEQFYLDRLRRLTIEQRWRIVAGLRQVAVNMVRAEVRAGHPDWTEAQIRLEATRRIMEAHGTTFRIDRQ